MESNEKEFERLGKLLELKRHEVPPPGYFEDLSAQVIARIEAEDARVGSAWWRKLISGFDSSPLMVGAYGVIVASLVICGIQLAGNPEPADSLGTGNNLADGGVPAAAELQPHTPAAAPGNDVVVPAFADPAAIAVVDELKNTVRPAPTGMFDPPSLYTSKVERASFPQNQ